MRELIVLMIYGVVMVVITLLFTQRSKDMKSFYVGNREMGTFRSAMSIAATWIWAPALFVSAEKAYTNGFAGLFWFTVPNVLCLIIFIPFAKRIRKEMPEGITLSGYMNEKYQSRSVKNVYLLQLGGLSIFSTAVQLLAGGMLLSATTGIPFTVMAIVLAVIAYAYSQFSGIESSVTTDTVQMLFILGACAFFVPSVLGMNGGLKTMFEGLGGITGDFRSLTSNTGKEVFLGFGLSSTIGLLSGPFGDQCFWQRTFSIKENKIGKSFFFGAMIFALMPLSMGSIGFMAAAKDFSPADTSIVNYEFIQSLFPGWVVIPFMLMLASGLLSTIDSNLCAISSLTSDFIRNNTLRKSKITMIILLILGLLIAHIPGITVTKLFLFYGTLRATTLLPTVMTLLGKKLTAKGVTAGVIAALCIGLPVMAYGTLANQALWKAAGSLLTLAVSSGVALVMSRKGARSWM